MLRERTRIGRTFLQSLAAALLFATCATAADWSQFRHDGNRTGQSEDRVPGPLTDIWTWSPGNFKASRPYGSVAIWGGRLYTFSRENNAPYLVCVDARTGTRFWQHALGAAGASVSVRPDAGPAVSAGSVYAYGATDVRAYNALDGRLIAYHSVLLSETPAAALVTSRVFLRHDGRATLIPPGPRALFRLVDLLPGVLDSQVFRPHVFGPPLLNQGELFAVSGGDRVMRWGFNSVPEYTRIAHFSARYPYLDMTPGARFEGFPSALVNGGLVIADDSTWRFIGVMYPGRGMGWHWDIPWTIGIPSTEASRIFLGIGGLGARGGLLALKSGTGEPIWMYPLGGRPADFQGLSGQPEKWHISHVLDGRVLHPLELFGASAGYGPILPFLPPPHRVGLRPTLSGYEPAGTITRIGSRGSGRGNRGRERNLFDERMMAAEIEQEVMRCPTVGHLTNIGLVLARRRVYGWVDNSIVSVDQESGRPIWIREQPHFHPFTSLAASQEQLILCQSAGTLPTTPPTLWGLDLETGKLEWSIQVANAGQLAIGHGLLFLNTGESITAYAPAERTFRMAIDSPQKEHYHEDPGGRLPPDELPELSQCEPGVPEEVKPAEPKPAARILPPLIDERQPAPPLRGLADATILRLHFGQPLSALLQAARERRRASGDLPRVLVLDWFTPDRRSRTGGVWTAATVREFANVCARLAAEFEPDHFEIAPEVNVYLAYHPTQVEEVRSLLRAAREAIRKAAPETKTLISFNAEVLNGTYGRARYFPFRDVPVQPDAAVQRQLSLLEEVDEAGVTTSPQSGNIGAEQVGPTYLQRVAARFGAKPLLVTRAAVRVDERAPTGPSNQLKFMKRIVQALYWLNASVVAYPDLIGGKDDSSSLKAGEEQRPALELWKDTLRWKRVKELTAARPAPSR